MYIDYDRLAQEYGLHRRVHPEVLRCLLHDGRVTRKSRVCEVGCGTGNYIAAIAQATWCECWGLDPSAAMLAQAKGQCPSGTFCSGRAEDLDLSGRFDLVYSVDVIHHVTDPAAYFQRAARLLIPGGRLCTVTDSEEIIRTRRPLAAYFPETIAVELQRYPRMADLRLLMKQAGFTALQETTVEHAYMLTDLSPYRHKTFSSLHLISESAFARGIARMECDLQSGPIPCVSRYVLLWGTMSGVRGA